MKKTWALVIVTGLASLQAIQAGDISGTVTLKGTPPPEKEIPQIKEDPNCGKLHTEAVKTRFYVVGANNGLGDVFVTLKGITGKSMGASATASVNRSKRLRICPVCFGGPNRTEDRRKEFRPCPAQYSSDSDGPWQQRRKQGTNAEWP